MDPIRRLLLLGLIASVILAEPSGVRALCADARPDPVDVSTVAANRLIRRLVIAFRRTAQTVAESQKQVVRKTEPKMLICTPQVKFVPAALTAHEFRPPPPTC